MTDAGARKDHTRSVVERGTADKRATPAGRRGRVPAWRLLALCAFACAPKPALGQSVPPDENWRTIATPHFTVAFPERLEALGRRSAVLAEQAWARIGDRFVDPPDVPVEVVLTDHVDASNGFATVAPRLQVVIYARPPVDGRALSYYDDWLDVVIVHELAHIFHLDRAGPIGRLGRRVFGRVPTSWPLFPGQASPRWTVEGVATWFESELTGTGRADGSEFEMMLRAAALDGGVESIDRASGDSPAWPGGQRPYLYGGLFFDWLLEEHGAERLAAFVEAVAGQWVPYRLNAAGRTAFGASLEDEWARWSKEVELETQLWADSVRERSGELPAPALLTDGARQVGQPRVSPAGDELAWHQSDGRSDSRIVVRELQTGREQSVRTNGGGAFDWLPDGGLVFAQFETDGPWRVWSDLYTARDGEVRRITSGARLDHPSAHPQGAEVVAIRSEAGHTDLVRVDLADGSIRQIAAGSDSVHWAFPAISPEGRWVAVSRWTPQSTWEVVVIDLETGVLQLRLDPVRGVALGSGWSPDGDRVVFGSDRSGVANLYTRRVDPERSVVGPLVQHTDLVTGATAPSISPDGEWVHAALYTARGWEVARWPLTGGRPPVAVQGAPAGFGARVRVSEAALDSLVATPYRAIATLRPTYWEPLFESGVSRGDRTVLGPFIGASTTLRDMVERHSIALGASVGLERGRLDASATWRWQGWGNPIPSLSIGQGWQVSGPHLVDGEEGETVFIETRDRRAELSATLLRPRWRSNLSLTGTVGWVREDRTLLRGADLQPHPDLGLTHPRATLGDFRVALGLGTARRHTLSLTEEQGLRLSVVARHRPHLALPDSARGVDGADRSADEIVGEFRAYGSTPGWGWTDHILALRLSGGVARGPGAESAWYAIGDAAGQPESVTGLDLFGGRSLTFPVRGFARGARRGNRAWTASAEWRFPLAWIRRGTGLFPLYLESLHGALFTDAGHAWRAGEAAGEILTSVGGELRLDTDLFYTVSMRLRLGLATTLSGGSATRVYLRLGQAF